MDCMTMSPDDIRREAYTIRKGVCPNLKTETGGYSQPLITLVGGVGDMDSNNNTQYKQQNRIYDSEGLAISECTSPSFNPWYTEGGDENQHIRIRKLTPRECWRSSHGFHG